MNDWRGRRRRGRKLKRGSIGSETSEAKSFHMWRPLSYFLALLIFMRVRMANLKSDDWRENMKERFEKEKTEKKA